MGKTDEIMATLNAMIDHFTKSISGKTIKIKFVGIDSWNRPIFKTVDLEKGNFYAGDSWNLFDYDATEEEVLRFYKTRNLSEELTYFGEKFGCEPWGFPLESAKLEIVTEDNK